MSLVNLNKIECAQRQLDVAIKMWFFDEDVVSTHTLTCAAQTILEDLNSKLNKTESMKDIIQKLDKFVSPMLLKKLHKEINKYQNFFKHADRDPNETIQFNTKQTQLFLVASGQIFQALANEMTIPMKINHLWFAVNNSHLFSSESDFDKIVQKNKDHFLSMTKTTFYEKMFNASKHSKILSQKYRFNFPVI
jgi:hypothetical protein